MKWITCCLFLTICSTVFSQTHSAKELYDEYRANRYTFENKYKNQRITLTGKVRSISVASDFWKDQDVHRVHLTATGYENFVVCQIPYKDSAILKQFKVTGLVAANITDALFLSQCTFDSARTVPEKPSVPANAPLGKYKVYQNDGTGFNYQYTFNLQSYKAYALNGQPGSCIYDAKTKIIRFLSGPLKGFAGLYLGAAGNEKDPPTLLLNAKGTTPDANSSRQGYQFGYFAG